MLWLFLCLTPANAGDADGEGRYGDGDCCDGDGGLLCEQGTSSGAGRHTRHTNATCICLCVFFLFYPAAGAVYIGLWVSMSHETQKVFLIQGIL